MPSVNDLSESKTLGKDDVGNGKLVTVTGYKRLDMSKDNEPTEMKWVIEFAECKPLSLNVTNGTMMGHIAAETYGVSRELQIDPADADDPRVVATPVNTQFHSWLGKKFVLYNDPTIMYQSKMTGGIRVRAPQQQAQPQTQGGVTAEQQQKIDAASEAITRDKAKVEAEGHDMPLDKDGNPIF